MRVLKSDTVKVLAVTLALLGSLEALVRVTGLGATPADVAAGQFTTEDVHGEDWRDYLIVGREQSTSAVYRPFVEYTSGPVDGQFVNVTEQGLRCNVNGSTDCAVRGGRDEIWVFGGSTTFGYGVKNDETIPAYMDQMTPGYRVLNFGVASYYSTIERILFLNLLTQFEPPAAVVFIDGLNDFYYNKVPDVSGFSDELANTFELPDGARTLARLTATLRQSRLITLVLNAFAPDAERAPVLLRDDAALARVIARLEANMAVRSAAAERLGIQIVNVLQPVPLYGPGHSTSLVKADLLNLGEHVNSGRGYELIHENAELLADPTLLNLAEFGSDGQMYVDTVHYHPDFSKMIAERILSRLDLS